MPNFKEQLKLAGLTENESIVYQALLEMGPRPAGTISRRTGLHRRVIYDVTERLIQKGLIGYIVENNKKMFQASNPERFLDILNEEKNKINEVIPDMLALFNQTKEKQKEDTNFYKGRDGLKTVFEDQLETSKRAKNKEILILGASPIAYETLEFYFHWFDKTRVKEKIKARIIFNRPESSKLKIPKIPLSEIKYLPNKYSSPLAINIYGDKVAIILWSKDKPLAIVIRQEEIAQGYRNYFELMWKIANT